MSYSALVKSSKEKVNNYAIATKILDMMDGLRMDENKDAKRRWVWELIQNAKDVKYDNNKIQIEINLNSGGHLEFKHNGQPFTVDNLTFLIEQVSTKERQENEDVKPKTTGKFGTGFLTTHLLSEIVDIKGYLKEEELPYKPFELTLDRSGKTIKSVSESIQQSLEVLDEIEAKPPATAFDQKKLNTCFRYQLNNDGVDVAKTGLRDLETALAYALIFLPAIESVRILNTETTYCLQSPAWERDGIIIHSVACESGIDTITMLIATLQTNKVGIAVPVEINEDGNILVQKMSPDLPRLYCDFPLIGSENFAVPFVINSSFFNPNEPRNGIFLTDREDERITENKDLVAEAIYMYEKLVRYAAENGWKNLYNLADIGDAGDKKWLSKTWYKNSLQEPLQKLLLQIPLVDTHAGGRKSIQKEDGSVQVWFIAAADENIRETLWELCKLLFPSVITKKDAVHEWYDCLWKGCGKLTLKVLGDTVSGWKNLKTLEKKLNQPGGGINWLNQFYEVVNSEGQYIQEIISNKVALIPNQNGEYRLQKDLYFDQGIEESFKDILLLLGEDVRDSLRPHLIHTENKGNDKAENQITHSSRKPEYVVSRINKILVKREQENVFPAACQIIALFSTDIKNEKRSRIFEIAKTLFRANLPTKTTILHEEEDTWIEADKVLIDEAASAIASCNDLKTFTDQYKFSNDRTAVKWLGDFVDFLIKQGADHYLNLQDAPLLPNQKGNFITKDNVFLDDGTIDEKLKDICEVLEDPIREELLDKDIYLELSDNRTLSQQKIAGRINALVFPRFSEINRSDETKNAFRLLTIWFQKNKGVAESIFSELYTGRHKLYDDEEVVANMQKAEDVNMLMAEFDIADIDELRKRIANSTPLAETSQQQPITAELLTTLGISSPEEWAEALKDVNLAEEFSHTSTPTVEMYQYAHKLIERAKNKILDFLRTIPEYDCSGVEEIATTVLGGILHHSQLVNIVCRPSDHGEVIVFYSSEKDTLELPESELWIDNGLVTPRQLTLGKILKDTGIKRIPVKYE